jgi:hypothetical protein
VLDQKREPGRHDWFYYTSTKCAIPDDMRREPSSPSVNMLLSVLC